jgi:hypothetical protein
MQLWTTRIAYMVLLCVFCAICLLPTATLRRKPIDIDGGFYVINLDKSTDRWQSMRNMAERAAIQLKRFPAVLGNQISKTDWVKEHGATPQFVKDKTLGELGCFLSHRRLLEHLAKADAGQDRVYVILEDDVEIQPDFWKQWQHYSIQIPQDWQLVFLGGTQLWGRRVTQNIVQPGAGLALGNLGAFAYMVRGSHLNAMLKELATIDCGVDNKWQHRIGTWNIYYTYPFLVHHEELVSVRHEVSNGTGKVNDIPAINKYYRIDHDHLFV